MKLSHFKERLLLMADVKILYWYYKPLHSETRRRELEEEIASYVSQGYELVSVAGAGGGQELGSREKSFIFVLIRR